MYKKYKACEKVVVALNETKGSKHTLWDSRRLHRVPRWSLQQRLCRVDLAEAPSTPLDSPAPRVARENRPRPLHAAIHAARPPAGRGRCAEVAASFRLLPPSAPGAGTSCFRWPRSDGGHCWSSGRLLGPVLAGTVKAWCLPPLSSS